MTAAIELHDIVKDYPGVRALDDVSLDLRAGEVHGLIGENGAGKSTLIRILSGGTGPTRGRILAGGRPVSFHSPVDARRCGISTIFQELTMVPGMSVAENVMLGSEPALAWGLYSRRRAERAAGAMLKKLSLAAAIDPQAPVETLSIAQRQIVEIARSLVRASPVIVLDEPTAALSDKEADVLLQILRTLRDQGTAILFVSHRLDEVRGLADRVTVLRGGRRVATLQRDEITATSKLIELMVGRPLEQLFPPLAPVRGGTVFAVDRLSRRGVFHEVSFSVRSGEVLGVAGLIGAGRTEVMRSIFGADPFDGGAVFKDGRKLRIRSPADAIAAGIAYLPEDRKGQGLILTRSGYENLTLASLKAYCRWGLVSWPRVRSAATEVASQLQFRGRLEEPARILSGGNQQKLVVGKWVLSEAQVLIFDEPTRGIDVGAKAEVYRLVHRLAADGAAVVVVSSELPELLHLCHRMIVMSGGRVQAEFDAAEFDERPILAAAFAAHVRSGKHAEVVQ